MSCVWIYQLFIVRMYIMTCNCIYIHTCLNKHTHMHVHKYISALSTSICRLHMSKLPYHQCTPSLLAMVLAQLLGSQRTYCNSSSSMHSDMPLWSCLFFKCKMVVSLKSLQGSSKGTRLVYQVTLSVVY